MISGIDHVVGRVRKALDAKGVSENTLIVFSGDNGYYQGQRGFAGKWSHYEESLRVPLIIYDPSISPYLRGRTAPQMALNIDLPATFIDYADLPLPESYQEEAYDKSSKVYHQRTGEVTPFASILWTTEASLNGKESEGLDIPMRIISNKILTANTCTT